MHTLSICLSSDKYAEDRNEFLIPSYIHYLERQIVDTRKILVGRMYYPAMFYFFF